MWAWQVHFHGRPPAWGTSVGSHWLLLLQAAAAERVLRAGVGVGGDDIGRGILDPQMRHRFKTPGLRNIALRAPYMHNGSLNSLRAVVEHYRHGGSPLAHMNDMHPLDDMSDRNGNDLIAFLETLTAYNPHVSAPALPAD